MATLYLGSCDSGKRPIDRKKYLKPYHMDGLLLNKVSSRDDDRTKWRSFRNVDGNEVLMLQQFLFDAGFMPRNDFSGIFGYVTQAAVRLFQEYVRTIENISTMVPDGIVGSGTMKHITRWKKEGITAVWNQFKNNPTPEYKNWINLLNKAKQHYNLNPSSILNELNTLNNTYSSIKPQDWDFSTDKIHLIGVRRNQNESTTKRKNDDLFFLLINGMVFTFWGSTDPSVTMAQRKDEAFLIEGQHLYRFGWHKITNERKIYRALKPKNSKGVMIIRDWDNNNSLTNNDLKVTDNQGRTKGLQVNPGINIHWTGVGSSNFSAGCQVIAGKSYLNHNNELQNCSSFASTSYSGLTTSKKKTKGAYNMFTDLVLCYAPPNISELYYTLGREESLDLSSEFGSNFASKTLSKLQSI